MFPSRKPKAQREQYEKTRFKALALVGEVCAKCGYDDKRALQIDHVKGDGCKERRNKSGAQLYYHIIKECEAGRTARYQTLCANCNVLKRHQNKEYGPRRRAVKARRLKG